jgi:GT2 family glycosyltransferase
MFFRTNILRKVGFFDEDIFMYLEDADITRRFLLISKTVYYPKVIVYHHYAGLTHKKWKYKFITIKSAITYFNKWGWIKHIF